MPKDTPEDEGIGQHFDDINSLQLSLDPDGNEFSRELDHIEHPDSRSIMRAVLYKIIRLDMDGVFRLKPDARTVVQPEPTTHGLLGSNIQPLKPPCPLGPIDVHDQPASCSIAVIRRAILARTEVQAP